MAKRKKLKRKDFEAYVLRMGGELCLGGWCIHQAYEKGEDEDGNLIMGTAVVTEQYREATITWHPRILREHPHNLREIVVHELLHLRYAELQHIAETAISKLQPDAEAVAYNWQRRAMESHITVLARIIAPLLPRIDKAVA